MRSRTSKVSVRTAELLDAVKKRRTEMLAANEEGAAQFARDMVTYRSAVHDALVKALADFESDGILPRVDYRGWIELRCQADKPSHMPDSTEEIDGVIRLLSMVSDETILITAADVSEYLR